MVEIPGHRSTGRRDGEPSVEANCPSPPSTHALDDASLDELRCGWRRLYRSEPPRLSRDLLIRGVGYQLQEIQHGGLGKSTRRKLKTLAKMFRTEGRVGWRMFTLGFPRTIDAGNAFGQRASRPSSARPSRAAFSWRCCKEHWVG